MQNIWNDIKSASAVRTGIVAVLVLLTVFLIVESISVLQSVANYTNPSPNTITVSGDGTSTAIPDTATISFGATATSADVTTAQTQVTKSINDALASVKANGVASADITTTSFDVSPHYTTSVCPPVPSGIVVVCSNNNTVSGYDVSENVSVKIHDTSKVSAILDGLAKANVTNVSGPDFVLGDPDAVQAQARGMAIQKAQTAAQTLAKQLGVHLGKVVSYSDDSNGTAPQPMMYKAADAMDATASAPSVPVGQNTYTEDVSVTYEIH